MIRRCLEVLLPTFAMLMALQPVLAQIGPDEAQSRTQPYRPSTGLTLRTQVELVEVPVVVRNRKRQPVAGLTQNDFTILDLGKKQEIVSFSVENFKANSSPASSPVTAPGVPTTGSDNKPATQPRFIALCFDDMVTDPSSLMSSKIAARQFVQTSLAPGDQIAVVTTAFPNDFQFTSDVPTILRQIDKVNYKARVTDEQESRCPPIRPYEAYLLASHLDSSLLQAKVAEYRACLQNPPPQPEATILSLSRMIWERVRQTSVATLRVLDNMVQALAKAPGRRMILMASSGFYSGDLSYEENALIGRAIRAGVVINTLGARGLYTIVPGGDASDSTPARTARGRVAETRVQSSSAMAKDDGLAVLASSTGGTFFHNSNDLLKGFRELGMVPEVMYVLHFAPSNSVPDGRFHNLKVTLNKGSGYSVQARMGYSAPPKPAPPTPSDIKIDEQIAGASLLSEISAGLTWAADKEKTGITVLASVDLGKLKFEMRQKRRVQSLTIVVVLRDAKGNIVGGQRRDVDLNLTDETFANLVAKGNLNLLLSLKAPPGTYTARGLLLEGLEGKMVTSTGPVVLP